MLLLALLVAPGLAGCLDKDEGEEERLAVPTSRPVSVPTRGASSPTPQVNLTDPGYRMNGSWKVGDGWDYESDKGRVMRVRVVEERNVSGATHLRVEERVGQKGAALAKNVSWVDARAWVRLNATAPDGASERYQPGAPLRAFRNATLTYNVTRLASDGGSGGNVSVAHAARLRPTHQTLLFPWGYVEARVVEQTLVARMETGQRSQTNTTRWVHADYLNDVQFTTPSGETFKLVAVRAGEMRRGTLAP